LVICFDSSRACCRKKKSKSLNTGDSNQHQLRNATLYKCRNNNRQHSRHTQGHRPLQIPAAAALSSAPRESAVSHPKEDSHLKWSDAKRVIQGLGCRE
jgi:hypothetical protein